MGTQRRQLRDGPSRVEDTGQAAEDVDLIDSVAGRLPAAIALALAVSGRAMVLSAFTGSVSPRSGRRGPLGSLHRTHV